MENCTRNNNNMLDEGYTYIESLGNGEHLLRDETTGTLEVWGNSKGHESYGLQYKNTQLEFCHSLEA